MKNPLLNSNFLRQLDLTPDKTLYAKIVLLTKNEEPIEEIQGKITTGSINIDGNSAVRRTCSLTMVSPKVDINNTYWTLKNKFRLEVGVENIIDSNYPSIVWFKQGIYIFTSINMNVQSNNFTISLSGKDKMCLLNGEIGGTINASTDFGKMEEYRTLDNGEIVRDIIDIPIVDIIKNAVQVYGGEQLHNIILNDIDNYGLELLEYRVENQPMYMLRNASTGVINNARFNSKYIGIVDKNDTTSKEYDFESKGFTFYNSSALATEGSGDEPTPVYAKTNSGVVEFNVIKLEYGMTAGYRKTALTYPGELIANVGESLVSVLDKIKNMFGDFEYFYDVDGRFVFQKKKTYVNQSWSPIKDDGDDTYVDAAINGSSTSYSFEDGVLLSAFSNQPTINNIKNDFSIWGKKKGVGGQELPVHLRYAIDKKPVRYFPIRFEYQQITTEQWTNKIYIYEANKYYIRKNGQYILATETSRDNSKTYYLETDRQIINEINNADFEGDKVKAFTSEHFDWRELIYQMALDYFKYQHKKDNFLQLVAAANPALYPIGITGYETYYTDMQGFWRQLYHPGVREGYNYLITESEKKQAARAILSEESDEDITDEKIDDKITNNFIDIVKYYKQDYNDDGYNKAIEKYPETLNFWLDFMSVDGEMGKYSVSAIGSRPKAVNNDKITGIAFNDVPSIVFISDEQEIDYTEMTGYTFVKLPQNMLNYFTISSQGKSAWDELNSLLYQHTCITESSTLTTVPIYHLSPNTRIYINDRNTGVNGEYILNKITIPLQYNGTGSLTANKVIKRIY